MYSDFFIIKRKSDGLGGISTYYKAKVEKVISEIKPDAVIHCAAWTAVDMAEDDDKVEKVHAVNAGGERGGLPVIRGADVSQYCTILTDIYTLASSSDYIRDMRINGKLNDLLTLLMESSWHQGNSSNAPKKMDISSVKSFLDEHYSEKLSLESVARTYREMLKAPNKKKFRLEHQTEIELYEAAVQFLKSQAPDGKIPSMKSLKQEKENLAIQRKAQQETYDYFKDYTSEMKMVCTNVEAILDRTPAKGAEHTKQHDLD